MRTYNFRLLIPPLAAAPALSPPHIAAAQARTAPSTNGPYSDLSSTAPLVFIVFVSAAFITAFIAIYIRHRCHFDTEDGTTPLHTAIAAAATTGGQCRLSPGGLDPAVINSFPVFKYSEIKYLKIGKGELSCAVCVSDFQDNERLRQLPECDHVFHPECIDLWLASHSTCPICRATLSQGIKSTATQLTVSPLTGECNSGLEVGAATNGENQISITVDERETALRVRERVRMLPRPHSTGHSLVQLGGDCERNSLRLGGRWTG